MLGVSSLKTPWSRKTTKRIRKLLTSSANLFFTDCSFQEVTKWEILCNRQRTCDAIGSAMICVCLRPLMNVVVVVPRALFRGRIFNELTSRRQPISC